jgi:hypothetical protein
MHSQSSILHPLVHFIHFKCIHSDSKLGPPKNHKIHYTQLRRKIMENKEKTRLEAYYQRELERMKSDINRLTSILEEAIS